MLLLKISSRGLKGREFSFSLSPATAIVGPNFGGKTALVDSIRFLCCGRFPEIKKGSWPEMSVTGEFKGRGPALTLTRQINAKGTVASSGTLANSGDDERLDVPLLNPEYYFGLTDRERTNYVFERVTLPDSYSIDAIVAEIQRLSLGEEHSEEAEKAKKDLLVELREPFNQPSVQESLASAIEKLRERYTYWNRRCKETQGAVTTLTELKLRGETNAAPANLDAEITAATKAVEEANQKKGAVREQLLAAESAIANKKAMEQYLAEDRIDYDRVFESLRAKREPIAAEFERVNDAVMGVDLPAVMRTLREAEADNKKAEADLVRAQDARTQAVEALKDLEEQEHCPHCLSKSKGWKNNIRSVLEKRAHEAAGSIEAQSGIAAGSAARIAELLQRVESIQEMRSKADELRRQLVAIAEELDRTTIAKGKEDKMRAFWKKQLSEMKSLPDPVPLMKELEKADAKLEFERARLRELNETKLAETRLQQDLVRAGEAAREHVIAAAQLLVTKKVAKLIDSRRETMAGEVITKLLETANLLTVDILKTPLAFNDGVIGRYEGATFIEHHWFSGTEKALAYIAIAIALSEPASFRLVLLDEFGRLDGDNQVKVVNRLINLQKDGVIDQFILAGTHIAEYPFSKIKIIEVA